jgi:hypothetical protein
VKKLVGFVLGLVLLSGCAASSFAKDKPKAKTRTITGCLSKGDGSDEFKLTAKDGSTWELRNSGSQVSLTDHVGHMVTVTGQVEHQKMHNLKEDAKETAKDTGVKKEDKEHGHLKVMSIKHVSGSCS